MGRRTLGPDAFVQLVHAAEAPIRPGTSVVDLYSRTPAALARAAASVQRAAGAGFVLGLGTSTSLAVASVHGLEFESPIRRLHETAELVTRLFDSTGSVAYDGEVVSTSGTPGLGVDGSIYTAALGPATRRATGRVADGWVPHNIPFDRLGETFQTITDAARERGRDPGDIVAAPYAPARSARAKTKLETRFADT